MADISKMVDGKKRRPPESERYDELKGKEVVVVLGVDPGDQLSPWFKGILRWVDRYTLGVHIGVKPGAGRSDQVWIVSKAHVVMIGEA